MISAPAGIVDALVLVKVSVVPDALALAAAICPKSVCVIIRERPTGRLK
jgi:hypothetical protein